MRRALAASAGPFKGGGAYRVVKGRAGGGGKLFDDRLAHQGNDRANVFNLFHCQPATHSAEGRGEGATHSRASGTSRREGARKSRERGGSRRRAGPAAFSFVKGWQGRDQPEPACSAQSRKVHHADRRIETVR